MPPSRASLPGLGRAPSSAMLQASLPLLDFSPAATRDVSLTSLKMVPPVCPPCTLVGHADSTELQQGSLLSDFILFSQEIGFHYFVQAGLELVFFLLQLPQCWDNR